MFDDKKITLRLWFIEISLKTVPKGSFVGKRNAALFFKNKKIFKI
jgi:hypothetical protein